MQTDKNEEQMFEGVKERDNLFVVEINLSQFSKEEIKASFHDGYLIITAAHREPLDVLAEYKRAFYIGRQVSQEHIRAAFHGGILKCMIPKDGENVCTEPTEIEIM